ncbi:MAG: hypothetical protein L7S56_03130 [Candidatus Poseidonia sp.]|mgnify:CR=1 FL=1|nr:hypothetical protein [Poseidonia sp.]
MQSRTWVLSFLLLVGMMPLAQAQVPSGGSWELGWATDMDSTYTVDLEDDWDLTGTLVMYIDNTRANEVSVDFTYEYDEDGPFVIDGPESASISANTNDTITITITGASADEVRAFSPTSKLSLKITAEETLGETSVNTQEIEGDISTPRMYRLLPNANQPTDVLYAGSWVEFNLEVSNMGNIQDAIVSAEASIRGCPHLSVTGLESLKNSVVDVTDIGGNEPANYVLRLEASISHQERGCDVTVALESEGDGNTRSSTMTVQVVAPKENSANSDTEDGASEDDETSDSSSLPWIHPIEIFFVVFLTSLLIRRFEQ